MSSRPSARSGPFQSFNARKNSQFNLAYPKGATLSHQLSWSHVVELLKIDDPLERGFYEQQNVPATPRKR